MDNENIIDYGKWTVPTSWDEITLKQFQEIEKYYQDKDKDFDIRDVLEVFTDHSRDEVDQLPIDFVDKLLNELTWLNSKPKWEEPTNKVEIDGVVYQVNVREKLKTGEYIAVDTVLKSDKNNYAAIMAILCRKDGELFDSRFENELLGDRIKMWEKVGVTKVMPIISFFLECWLALQKSSQLSSMAEEAINLTRKDIENSHKDGVLSKRSMKSAMKKLKKLEKYIKSI
jgi:ribosomal protein S15P/S13E